MGRGAALAAEVVDDNRSFLVGIVVDEVEADAEAGQVAAVAAAGVVVAEVMDRQENVTVTHLPAMIRVDCVGRMDFVYDEISEALGEEEGFYDAAEFEENMSTHYGKMVHMDDRTVMFGNMEEAAEFIGDMLPPVVSKS